MSPRPRISIASRRLASAALAAVVGLGVAAAPGPAAAQQDQTPQGLRFRTEVELVRLSVSVVDDDGRFVTGLGPEDFRLRIDGRDREIAVVEEVDLTGGAAPAAGGDAELRSLPAESRRSFVLFLDTVFQRREKLGVSVDAAAYLLRERLAPVDRVALVAFTMRGAILVEPFTTDRDLVLQGLRSLRSQWSWQVARALGGHGDWVEPETLPIPVDDDGPAQVRGRELTPDLIPEWNPSYVELADLYLAGLHQLGLALQAEQGRKQLLLFSPGLGRVPSHRVGRVFASVPGIPDRITEPSLTPVDYHELREVSLMELAGEALRDANVAVHALSTAALRPGGGRPGLHFLWFFSDETGGSKRFHTHHLEGDAARAEALSRRYYLVGYRRLPDDPPRVNVDVEVLRDDVDVHAPTRMALPPPASRWTDLQRTLLGQER